MRLLPFVAALALLAGCAPTQSAPAGGGADDKTGTVRVWLFDEAGRAPKEAAVKDAIAEFKAAHAGVEVDVQWVPVEGRADKFSGAFNDPANAPDVAEFGNTDVSNYAATGALADLTGDLAAWPESKDFIPTVLDTAKSGGQTYGLPWYTGIRALYYRTDVFTELGLKPPATLAELTDTARRIRTAKPDLYGIAVGGKYTYAMLPFLWANGGELAQEQGGKWTSTVTGEQAKAGVTQYANLLKDDICPPAQCANLTGTQSVTAFAGGKAGMTIGGDFNRKAVEQGAVKGKYAVVPLPGLTVGSTAPAFAGGNLLGVFKASKHRSLALEFVELLGGAKYQEKMYAAMGNLPTLSTVQQKLAANDPFLKPFVDTLKAGTKFVPATPAWSKIDSQNVLPTAVQQIATGGKDPSAALADAAAAMNKAFG
ncbi:ABC transporter substrate-binding protein [Amycolatopsis mediterranei S699]|uniref:ABC transport system substrate-binding protein n=2 Tax=Amycolatopsis mediterranei TaxID=33910 RepID=A0A0H3DC74_AMYMU|nr:extracellular solute-binding protein [Amycolatopsis mediterranei]ADJ47807.1 ABC transport system substrate-binding protein [Amycolatopsis mediterranei U32]AEK44696.1 ABC transporter substrate-binding protein [Amycolatopsis mediterranei S699]AFO79518.1 ABC transporter substrate-binding protein [Amycolatopsis mediterranei S699]AGT86646.1 ABC transporter substrate-binding protein [Amycolatopsis mediterranei RB]KDO10388.1 ABC transporter substrate-binding protein [Amycolatopsis mediterranei]